MSDIKPCPNCGRKDCSASAEDHGNTEQERWWGNIFCQGCQMHGPDIGPAETLAAWFEQAAAAWNSLPRRLRWTNETPMEPGWYFVRYKGKATICRADYPKGSPYMTYRVVGSPDAWNTGFADEWAGPIPEPQEE